MTQASVIPARSVRAQWQSERDPALKNKGGGRVLTSENCLLRGWQDGSVGKSANPFIFKERVVKGWRDGPVVKNTGCSSRGRRFHSQHQHGSSQLSVTPALEDLVATLFWTP